MHTHNIILSAIVILTFQPSSVFAFWQQPPSSNPESRKVLLRDVTELTFKEGAYTTARRTTPVLQLQCVGGEACPKANIPVIQCRNVGWDGDVQWQCQAEMEDIYRFGTTEVSCEGYDSPNDPYVLVGSCGVEYTLHYTDKGRRLQKEQLHSSSWFGSYSAPRSSSYYENTVPSTSSKLAKMIWFIVGGIILYSMYMSWFHPSSRTATSSSSSSAHRNSFRNSGSSNYYGGGGPGGGGGYFGGFSPSNGSSCAPSSSSSGAPSSSTTSSTQSGFWTGLATGGILGHLLTPRRPAYYTAHPTFMNTGGFGGSSPFFGGSGFSSRPVYGGGFGGSSSRPSSSRIATGYGGTKRR